MRPPICAVCDRDFRDDLGDSDLTGGLVSFADFEDLPEGMVGHPSGMEWFCSQHIKKARTLSHLTSKQAIQYINLG